MTVDPGTVVEQKLRFGQADFDSFAALSGDDNPLHTDPVFAAACRFGRTIAHGMLLYGAICGALGRLLPGGRQFEQTLRFTAPVFADEELSLRLEVAAQPNPSSLVVATTLHETASDREICRGRALLGTADGDDAERERLVVDPEPRFATRGPALARFGLGLSATERRRFDTATVGAYRDLTGDAGLRFGSGPEAVPGPLLAGAISSLLGTRLPGRGTIWLEQTLRYAEGAPIGDEIVSRVEVVGAHPEKPLLQLRTTCEAGPSGVCRGEALVLLPPEG